MREEKNSCEVWKREKDVREFDRRLVAAGGAGVSPGFRQSSACPVHPRLFIVNCSLLGVVMSLYFNVDVPEFLLFCLPDLASTRTPGLVSTSCTDTFAIDSPSLGLSTTIDKLTVCPMCSGNDHQILQRNGVAVWSMEYSVHPDSWYSQCTRFPTRLKSAYAEAWQRLEPQIDLISFESLSIQACVRVTEYKHSTEYSNATAFLAQMRLLSRRIRSIGLPCYPS